MESLTASRANLRIRQYLVLTKPRVTQLAVFCAVIGMFLASPTLPPWQTVLSATIGIWLLAAAAFAVNCLIEEQVDAKMTRTAHRASARGEISAPHILLVSGIVGGAGMFVLYRWVNPLTMWLTFATFVGYAIIYTIILKPRTPQNIVIGGLSGAMPPALGWAAVANSVPAEAWLLVLIIFVWTPPHFWALALYRTRDYENSGLPMLPITHGEALTRLHILLYSIALLATTLLPYVIRMSGWVYLVSALVLGAIFVGYAWKLYRQYSDALARSMFKFSILYLSLLFAALLADHWLLNV
ncbi:heme o synthase [Pigmentiphaga litoralis]|uniref:Protoheme IX farnesyltransferase n=1 Tax=Pigmentiphaga litoralis TaxID=516702 RepID=A0A7Y9LM19_9BURK|nr:heme o synthase [Pigmentiphaga litoralis]NYE24713.1 protoheme IX farnesyltransferase [Pigmentiphaga litoralis]NYE81673.1 protoheme IX farnesyltransferase [Pigmentiphaga litoralis]